MSFFRRLFSGDKPEKGLTDEVNRLFNEYGPRQDWAAIRTRLDAMNAAKMKSDDLATWHHARGVVEFHAGNRPAALSIFEGAAKLFPQSSLIWFGLGQEYEFRGRVDEMCDCFRRVRLEEIGGPYLMTACRCLYLWDRIDEGRGLVEQVFDAYHRLIVIDPHFLYMRGLPFFSEAFRTLATLAVLAGKPEIAEKELDHARRRLKEYIFDYDEAALAAEVRGDRQPMIEWAEQQTAEMVRIKGPTGLHQLAAAIHRARGQYNLEEARKLVDAVKLTPRDFPWLEDVRLIYHAELAAASEDFDQERQLVEKFFARQPLLFEPYHAFSFGLIKYQERLKPAYQRTRRG